MSQTAKTTRRARTASARGSSAKHDSHLRESLQKKLREFPHENLHVDVAGGFVTLKGSVRSYLQKERMRRLVMGAHGVRALKDLLTIQPQESVSDRQVALYVRHALDAHAELPTGTATAHVHAGQVTLEGHVRSAEERHVAERVACHCRGVVSVVNQLTVDSLEEISDEATVRVVHSALAYCEDFETEGVTVSCADGRVCLRGEVPTLLDRQLAEQVTRLQAGVRSVENHIVVTGSGTDGNGVN